MRAGFAWPAVPWIAGLHAGAFLAFVPGYFTRGAVAAGLSLYWLTAGIGICLMASIGMARGVKRPRAGLASSRDPASEGETGLIGASR